MLNELMVLHKALEEQGCNLGESHPDFRPCPKGKPCFLVCLDGAGRVKDVRIPELNLEEVYRWQENFFSATFPAFNARSMYAVRDPLPVFPEESAKNILALVEILTDPRKKTVKLDPREPLHEPTPHHVDLWDQTLEELEKQSFDLWDDDIEWIGKCLKDIPSALRMMLGAIPKQYRALEELIARSNQCDPLELKKSIRSILKQKLSETGERIYAEALFSVLTEAKKRRRGRDHGKDFLYLLSIDDWQEYPPYHRKIQEWMKSQLAQFSRVHDVLSGRADAFGLDAVGAKDVFKSVNVGGLGPTIPFAANDQIPCLQRYGLEGTYICPAGKETREKAAKSIAYILDHAREGITWKGITKYEPGKTGKTKRPRVVFAYCTVLKDANTVRFFVREDDDVDQSIYRSEAATKLALAPFDGIAGQEPTAKIVVNVLGAVDSGNTKILANREYKVSDLLMGASRWQAACANIPTIDLPKLDITTKKDSTKKIKISGAIRPYPLEAIKLLNSDWQKEGTVSTLSKRFRQDEGLDLLFEQDKAIAHRIEAGLGIVAEKTPYVLIRAKLKAFHDRNDMGSKIKFKDSNWLHMLPCLYGLLLYKKGIRKETYMRDQVFHLGRYFAVVDDLYIQYHKDVRSGDIPLGLLGNDHMALALQNPMEAFVALSRRLAHPYLSWAKRVTTDDKPGQIAKYCLKKIADIADELSNAQLPTDIDDANRAKLLLGYLSYGAKNEQAKKNSNPGEEDQEGESP